MARDRERKGTFSSLRLSVARGYLRPASRRHLLWLGGIAALILALLVFGDFFFRGGQLLSGGALSSSHAVLQNDCASCHDPFGGVAAENCSSCHEKYGDSLGVYSFSSHYVYLSNDFQRVSERQHEVPCSSCHTEHQGRDARITRVDDSACLGCHEFGSFSSRHPPFDAGLESPGIEFPHIHHVRELMEKRGFLDVERACLACHEPLADGRHFEPPNFDRHCSSCHLNGVGTPRLPIQQADPAGEADQPGVETLATLRARGGADSSWAFSANPVEFKTVGSRVSKQPIHHADPWILENLRRLRRRLYPEAGLADLLVTSPDVPPGAEDELYHEAVLTLKEQARGLRTQPQPALQQELDQIEELLARVDEALRDPLTPLDEGEFFRGLSESRPGLDPELVVEIEELVEDLTRSCQGCHWVEQATIARVEEGQQTYARAEFNHRAHVLDRRCLDCHGQIPIAAFLAGEEVDLSLDRSEVRNLPGIETCRGCHAPRQVSSTCVTCHEFHPQKSHTSLLRYVE